MRELLATVDNLIKQQIAINADLEELAPKLFQAVRQERGWSTTHLADLLGVGQSYISMIENSYKPTPIPLLQRLIHLVRETKCPECGMMMIEVCPHCGYQITNQ